jgi:hypothetical protein
VVSLEVVSDDGERLSSASGGELELGSSCALASLLVVQVVGAPRTNIRGRLRWAWACSWAWLCLVYRGSRVHEEDPARCKRERTWISAVQRHSSRRLARPPMDMSAGQPLHLSGWLRGQA